MSIQIDGIDMLEMFPIIFFVLIVICILATVLNYFVGKQDDNKELITRKVKVLEKPIQQGKIEWYVVECENGERLKLRNLKADVLIIAVGDEGTIGYKGQTVQSFERK